MTISKYVFSFALSLGGMSSISLAEVGFADRIDRDLQSRAETEFSAVGILQCENGAHVEGEPCQMKFTRLSDSQTFSIQYNPELISIHCDNHKDAKVLLKGEGVFQAAFGEDQLRVDEFVKFAKLTDTESEALIESAGTIDYREAAPSSRVRS